MRVYNPFLILSLAILVPVSVDAASWRYSGGSDRAAVAEPEAMVSQATPAKVGARELDLPRNNMSQAAVRQRYGDPEQEMAAVGRPPISRWRYPDYIVYFERDKVIISVPADVGVNR